MFQYNLQPVLHNQLTRQEKETVCKDNLLAVSSEPNPKNIWKDTTCRGAILCDVDVAVGRCFGLLVVLRLCFASYLPLHSKMWPCQRRNTYSSSWPYRGTLPATLQTPQLKTWKRKVSFVWEGPALYVVPCGRIKHGADRGAIQEELDRHRSNNRPVRLIYVHIVVAEKPAGPAEEPFILWDDFSQCSAFVSEVYKKVSFYKLVDLEGRLQYRWEAKGALLSGVSAI